MIGLANPWVILGFVLALIGATATGYFKGRADYASVCDAKIVKMQDDTQAAKDAEAAKINEASTGLETKNAEARVIYRTITRNVDREVEKPVYRNVCLETDGLALANAALMGLPVAAPAQLPGMAAGAVP